MFSRKLTFILLIILLAVALGLAGVFWYLSRAKSGAGLPVSKNQNVVKQKPSSNLNVNQNINAALEPKVSRPEISEEEKLKAQLAKMASAFSERYGSYSNQSDFENLEDLMPFMSPTLKSKTEDFMREKRVSRGSEPMPYYGITTKSLKIDALDFSPASGQAKFKVATQRQEIIGTLANARVYYQDIELEMVKEDGVWKVDNVKWQ